MTDALDRALAAIALDEFQRRRRTATRKVASGHLTPGDANGLLLPWAALACRLGADVPDLAEQLTVLRAIPGSGPGGTFFSEAELRIHVADEVCPLPLIRETLADARDAALERAEAAGDEALTARARNLCTLATAFGIAMSARDHDVGRAA